MTRVPPPVEQAGTVHADAFVTGACATLSPLVRRILAPNPSVMTGPGTNTYLIGHNDVTVIDPGPDDPAHVDAILTACNGAVRRIVCTHTHVDHWPGAPILAERTGAPILAFDSRDGLEVDDTFVDGDRITTDEYTLRGVHTPGHASNHVCVLLEDEQMLFTGDHVMQGTTVVIAPPDGDMSAYFESLHKLLAMRPALRHLAPAHGHVIDDPPSVINAYLAHREMRESIVAEALAGLSGGGTVDDLVRVVYADVDAALYPIARLSLWAHLRKLANDALASCDNVDDVDRGHWQAISLG